MIRISALCILRLLVQQPARGKRYAAATPPEGSAAQTLPRISCRTASRFGKCVLYFRVRRRRARRLPDAVPRSRCCQSGFLDTALCRIVIRFGRSEVVLFGTYPRRIVMRVLISRSPCPSRPAPGIAAHPAGAPEPAMSVHPAHPCRAAARGHRDGVRLRRTRHINRPPAPVQTGTFRQVPPSCVICTAAAARIAACGSAFPTSSDAQIAIRRAMNRGSSPPSSIRASQYTVGIRDRCPACS